MFILAGFSLVVPQRGASREKCPGAVKNWGTLSSGAYSGSLVLIRAARTDKQSFKATVSFNHYSLFLCLLLTLLGLGTVLKETPKS